MTKQNKWVIRPYQPGDEAGLVTLFAQVFGRAITIDHWLWKVKGMPSSVDNVWVVEAEGRLVGQYVAVPVPVWLGGQIRQAMVSVDTMVDPAYRRQGMLTALGEQAYAAWAEAGVAYVVGLPNEKWGSRTQALGWDYLFPLQWIARPLRPEQHLANRLKLPFLSRLTILHKGWNWVWEQRTLPETAVPIYEVGHDDPKLTMLWQQTLQTQGLFSLVRDSAWVQWRFLDAPLVQYHVLLAERDGTPVGYGAYRVHQEGARTVGFIAELVTAAADKHAFHSLLQGIVQRLLQAGAETAVSLSVPHTQPYRFWQEAGFIPRPAAFTVQIVPLAADLPLEAMKRPTNWILSGADFDVI